MNSKENNTKIPKKELGRLGVQEEELGRLGVHFKNVVGAISSKRLQQPNNIPICTWIILLITAKYFKEFIEILRNFSKKNFDQFQAEVQREAIQKFDAKKRQLLRSSPGLNKRQREINARRSTSANIFNEKNSNSLPGFTKKWWTEDRVSAELGGNPEEQRQEIKAFLEECLQPYHLILATRCNHSFFYFMISSGLVLIYDTIFSHLFIVNREGALQHFFRNQSLGDQENDLFDSNDVYIAYRNMKPIMGNFGQQDDLKIFMAQLLMVSININIKINLGVRLLNVASNTYLNNWSTLLEEFDNCQNVNDFVWDDNDEQDEFDFVWLPDTT